MYGTVARIRIKESEMPGIEEKMNAIGVGKAPGQVGVFVYRLDSDSREFIMTAIFESKEAYIANANSPEQHERFMQIVRLLDKEPEWNDGQIVYAQFNG